MNFPSVSVNTYCHALLPIMKSGWINISSLARQVKILSRCMESCIFPERWVFASLPRNCADSFEQFKIAVAVPPTNDVDVFTNDVGFIAIVEKAGNLAGFNVTAGGGMGVTHGNKKTYPRLGDVLGFCTVDQGPDVAEKIMLVQRDNGN